MNTAIDRIREFLGALPLSRKISIVFILLLVVSGIVVLFLWGNQQDYGVLFNHLSPEDGGTIIEKLKEQHVPYRVEGNGTVIMVPSDKVYDLRLTLAGEGLPSGGTVGFEIFDNTDFRTTKFVQELNYRRALQGELARTLNRFKEVKSSRVFIVIPKDSLFQEDKKPATASIQVDLASPLPSGKVAAIVHLVASAVEGLDPEHVTVVDTRGRVIFKGEGEDRPASLLSSSQLEYKRRIESGIRENIQGLLEEIVGPGKAVARVTAEIDFNKVVLNQEEYDPSTTAVRSQRSLQESSQSGGSTVQAQQTILNRRSGIVPPASSGSRKTRTKKDATVNYEINKITREIIKPAGSIKRLSVAVVIDGTYRSEKLKDGTVKRVYVPRTTKELETFKEVVKKAMGYNEDREDQVSVTSIPFSGPAVAEMAAGENGTGFLGRVGRYRKTIINLVLMAFVFLFVIRPLMKGLKRMVPEPPAETGRLSPGEEEGLLEAPDTKKLTLKEKILEIQKMDPDRTQQLIRAWIGEQE